MAQFSGESDRTMTDRKGRRMQAAPRRRPASTDEADATSSGGPPRPPARSSWPLTLIVVAHPDSAMLGRSFELPAGISLTVGREPKVDLSFLGRSDISRWHARVWEAEGEVWVEDLKSRNGTAVNGERVTAPHRLANGDILQVGSVYLKFFAGNHVERAYYDAMYELASRDELTGVHNRRKLDEELDREFALASRYHRPLALVLLDIDGLKSINDRYGHRAGDLVLRQVADLVGRSLRRETVFARLGGDEFAVLCPETSAEAGREMVTRLRTVIDRHLFTVAAGDLHVSCSFGVAQIEASMKAASDLYQAADTSLYAWKGGANDPAPRLAVVAPADPKSR